MPTPCQPRQDLAASWAPVYYSWRAPGSHLARTWLTTGPSGGAAPGMPQSSASSAPSLVARLERRAQSHTPLLPPLSLQGFSLTRSLFLISLS